MSDLVNDFFQQHYPKDLDPEHFRPEYLGGGSYGRAYKGPHSDARIFPQMVCADGTCLSVQGHFGAYSHPRDDFAENYLMVEILGPRRIKEFGQGHACGEDEEIYGYVPVATVCEFIVAHGGLAAPAPINETAE